MILWFIHFFLQQRLGKWIQMWCQWLFSECHLASLFVTGIMTCPVDQVKKLQARLQWVTEYWPILICAVLLMPPNDCPAPRHKLAPLSNFLHEPLLFAVNYCAIWGGFGRRRVLRLRQVSHHNVLVVTIEEEGSEGRVVAFHYFPLLVTRSNNQKSHTFIWNYYMTGRTHDLGEMDTR